MSLRLGRLPSQVGVTELAGDGEHEVQPQLKDSGGVFPPEPRRGGKSKLLHCAINRERVTQDVQQRAGSPGI